MQEYKTSAGNVLGLKDYITGGDFTEYQQSLLGNASLKGMEVGEVQPTFLTVMYGTMIRLTVLELNGDKSNLEQRIKDLPNDEFQEIIAHLNKTFFFQAKKK